MQWRQVQVRKNFEASSSRPSKCCYPLRSMYENLVISADANPCTQPQASNIITIEPLSRGISRSPDRTYQMGVTTNFPPKTVSRSQLLSISRGQSPTADENGILRASTPEWSSHKLVDVGLRRDTLRSCVFAAASLARRVFSLGDGGICV